MAILQALDTFETFRIRPFIDQETQNVLIDTYWPDGFPMPTLPDHQSDTPQQSQIASRHQQACADSFNLGPLDLMQPITARQTPPHPAEDPE